MNDDDETDMTEAQLDDAYAAGVPVRVVVPVGWRCPHMHLAYTSAAGLTMGRPVFGCGCTPEPVFAPGDEPAAL